MTIPKEIWTLPRPRKPYYPGSFPLYFEIKLIRLLENPQKILHSFGGHAEYGTRIDLNLDVNPDILADAHFLPLEDESFNLVICDPPYNDKLSEELYNAPIAHAVGGVHALCRVQPGAAKQPKQKSWVVL